MFNVDCLDIVIARNCQLNCRGCITFSDHNLVKGYTPVKDAEPWIEFWSKKLKPKTLHLFGGEPLMHPQLFDWVKLTNKFFKQTIDIQTNGIKVSSLNYDDLSAMILDYNVNFAISVHSKEQWYKAQIDQAVEIITGIIGQGIWQQNGIDTKTFIGKGQHTLTLNETTTLPWVSHYQGFGSTLEPGNNFHSDHYIASHSYCEAKQFIQLNNGYLYKCPPLAVLDDTLSKYNYPNKDKWQNWLNYKPLSVNCSDLQIENWISQQSQPEQYCNMCFGSHGHSTVHDLKVKL